MARAEREGGKEIFGAMSGQRPKRSGPPRHEDGNGARGSSVCRESNSVSCCSAASGFREESHAATSSRNWPQLEFRCSPPAERRARPPPGSLFGPMQNAGQVWMRPPVCRLQVGNSYWFARRET